MMSAAPENYLLFNFAPLQLMRRGYSIPSSLDAADAGSRTA